MLGFQSAGCSTMSIKNMQRFPGRSSLKKTGGRLIIECDEVWSFVIKHDNKQWVWLAIDRDTREIVGLYMGDRSAQSAQHLWDSLPLDYRQNALSYTDFWEAYAAVFPATRHLPVGQESGKTNHIERFNNTLRQRVSRLVRKALSFSKKLEIPYRSHLVFYSSL